MTTATMALQARSFDVPDESAPIGSLAQVETIQLAGTTANRVTFRPGFRWTEHARPIAGTELCEVRHTGYVVSGRSGIRLADGTERELSAGDVFDIPPGHDMWVIGDEPYVAVDFAPAAPGRSGSGAEDAVPPKDHRVLLENDRVRMLEMRIKPGQKTGMHSHPPCAVYALSSARVRFSLPDGSSREADITQGEAAWSDGGWHDVENVGTTDDWGIIVELKA
jgi:quercetin dioxygenase-like cupin family protein